MNFPLKVYILAPKIDHMLNDTSAFKLQVLGRFYVKRCAEGLKCPFYSSGTIFWRARETSHVVSIPLGT